MRVQILMGSVGPKMIWPALSQGQWVQKLTFCLIHLNLHSFALSRHIYELTNGRDLLVCAQATKATPSTVFRGPVLTEQKLTSSDWLCREFL